MSHQTTPTTSAASSSRPAVRSRSSTSRTASPTRRTPRRRREPADDLHLCPECDGRLVYPVEWEEAVATHWEVELRCPNCEWLTVGVFDQDTVDRFDEELDHGTEALVARPQAAHPRQHGGGDRALLAARSPPTPSGRWTSRRTRSATASATSSSAARCPSGSAGQVRLRRRDHLQRLGRAPPPARPWRRSRRTPPRPAPGVRTPRRSSAASSGSRSRARISGSVTVPSSRSVPRCLPVRSAGPGDVEHVVEQLEREPDAAAEVAERLGLRRRPRARRARTRPGTAARS